MSTTEQEEQNTVSVTTIKKGSVATIRKGHELVDIAKILLLLARKWEKAEKWKKNIKLEIKKITNGEHCSFLFTRTLGLGEEGEGLEEQLQELYIIAYILKALSRANQEVKITISLT